MSPFGWLDFNGADYGLSINLKNGQLENCILDMHDSNVDIEYLKGEVSQTSDEPEIISLAKRANAQYQETAVEEPIPYQLFFEALEKSMFLTAHEVD